MVSPDESIPELIRGTIRDGIGLVRDEILLARTELREEIVRLRSGLIAIAAAAVVGVLGMVMILDSIAWGASYAFEWPAWAGFAVVALPLVIGAIALAMWGQSRLSRTSYMPKSVATLKENTEWIRARTQS
jgi:uncharacterized membrane protein YqjE